MSVNTILNWRGVGTVTSNLLLSVLYFFFAFEHLQAFIISPRLSILLIVAVESLLGIMLIVRRDPDRTHHSLKTWFATFCGTCAPLLLRPTEAPVDLLFGQALQIAGFALQIVAVLSLNRSFGLLPAHRGIQSNGLYRWVRHPLYSAYLLAHIGYVINNMTWYNLAVVVFGTGFQIVRIIQEERFLCEYETYVQYRAKTRWRLIPAIW